MAKARKQQSNTPAPQESSAIATPDREQPVTPEIPTAPQSAGDTTAAAPERDRIAMRAYELYLERGGGQGRDLDDWLQAEQEVNTRSTNSRDE